MSTRTWDVDVLGAGSTAEKVASHVERRAGGDVRVELDP